jgi:uncharacterized protein
VTKVLLSQIPESGSLAEKGLKIPLDEAGLGEPFLAPGLELDYEFRRIQDKILASFKARGRMGLTCSRCLEDFETEVRTEFLLEFEREPEEVNPRGGADPEDAELNVVFFKGERIEFGEELRQEMELLVPFAPLCSEDCPGLCPSCGTPRSQGCECKEEPKAGPFSALKDFFQKEKHKES